MHARAAMSAAALAVLCSATLSGCGATASTQTTAATTTTPTRKDRVVYERPGVSKADQQRDENDCLRSSLDQDPAGRILLVFNVDRDAFDRCMQGKGYRQRPLS
jgi:hypothetical protein